MKLATLKDGSRDGQLLVVSRDLGTAHFATGIAQRLQQALDDWNFIAPQLQDLYDALNHGRARHPFPFDPAQCMAPLPRTGQRIEGAAYPNHLQLMQPALADAPGPLLRQRASDDLRGPRDDVQVADEAWGIDFGGELVAIVADVPLGATPEQGLDAVRLLMLANDTTLRQWAAPPAAQTWGAVASQPATAFSPVAVTPDELGDAWQDGRVHLTLQTSWNGRKVGMADAGADMRWGLGELIAHAARTRRLRAGTLVGTGPVSNAGVEANGRREWPKGYASVAEKRAMEALQDGTAQTAYLRFGDTVRIDMRGRDGQPLFGAIEQKIVQFGA